jgi:hypothetical protein
VPLLVEGVVKILEIGAARDVLRIDGTDNDEIINNLLEAIPGFIETSTGMMQAQQEQEPLINVVSGFLLKLWYNAEQSEAEKLQRTIDSLLKCIKLKVSYERVC